MYPHQHFIFGTLFAGFLLLLFPQIRLLGFSLIIISSIFIDVDHYIYYVYKKRDFNLKKAFNWYVENEKKARNLPKEEKRKYYFGIMFLHGFEFLLIPLILSFYFQSFLFVLTGLIFHQFLDVLYMSKNGYSVLKVISPTYIFISKKDNLIF